ncbi:MAG: deoxyribonuclease IV [Bacilli bacterium]|nr:deoxyribonuclease IV [Bacilli bacterium]
MELIIGSNVSFTKDKGLLGSVEETLSYNANTFMFYTGSNRSRARNPINSDKTYEAFKLMIENNINPKNVIVHSPFLINLANKKELSKYNFSIDFLITELERTKELGFDNLVLHPGSAINCTKEEGIENIAEGINEALSKTEDTNILLEYMSGKGNEVGSSIDELKQIIEKVNQKDRIYVCLDTCHMNDSGIDLTKIDDFLDEFDEKIGIDKIKCIHINDSLNEISSHKDRHANIGYGKIGFETITNIIYNKRLEGKPFLLETPFINRNMNNAKAPYKEEIKMIREKKFTDFINQ